MKTKYILIGVLIGIIAFPTIALGGTFASSLIQGKTVDEAIQILATQVDSLIGRIEILEVKQLAQEQLDACRFMESALNNAQMQGGIIDADIKDFDELISRIIIQRDNSPQDQYEMWQSRLKTVQVLKDQYLSAKNICEE